MNPRRDYEVGHLILSPNRWWFPHRLWISGAQLLTFSAVGVLLYSFAILTFVATSGDLGIRCVLGTKIKDVVPGHIQWLDKPGSDRV